MAAHTNPPRIDLPRGWPQHVRSALLHVIALAEYAVAYTRGWAVDGRIARLRLKAENDQLRQEVALLTEEIRIKDARMKRVEPQRQPHYVPTERTAVLELLASHTHRWPARRSIHSGNRVPMRGATPAGRFPETRGVGCHEHIWPSASSRETCAPQD